jgi:hypothetical protein
MRRTTLVVLLLAVVALVVAAAAPAGAVKAEKTSFIVAECPDANNPISVERFESPNPDRILIRAMHNLYHEWVLESNSWRLFGTNETTANGNVTADFEKGTFWGTFDFQDDGTIGDITGTWAWGMSALGRATGKTADGDLVKITLGLDPADYPTIAGDCGITEFEVLSPHG